LALIVIIVIVVVSMASDDDSGNNKTTVPLSRHYIADADAICNDGSPATYYLRDNGSDKWLIYVEGGFLYCWDEATCATRLSTMPELMTSTDKEETMEVTGLLSGDCDINPEWCDANFAFINYCSSDYFAGTNKAYEGGNPTQYHFMGWHILQTAINELLTVHGMEDASKILYTGKGGGAVAVLFNLDRVVDQIRAGLKDDTIDIRGLSDTGWISDREPYSERNCTSGDAADCNIAGGVQLGYPVWEPELPPACAEADYTWECFFGKYSAQFIETPFLIFMYEYDFAQLDTDGCDLHAGFDTECADWANEKAKELVETELAPNILTGLIPGCFEHEDIDKENWKCISVDKGGDYGRKTLPEMMDTWYETGEKQHWMDLDYTLPAPNEYCDICS
jgi:hypothetical protein